MSFCSQGVYLQGRLPTGGLPTELFCLQRGSAYRGRKRLGRPPHPQEPELNLPAGGGGVGADPPEPETRAVRIILECFFILFYYLFISILLFTDEVPISPDSCHPAGDSF